MCGFEHPDKRIPALKTVSSVFFIYVFKGKYAQRSAPNEKTERCGRPAASELAKRDGPPASAPVICLPPRFSSSDDLSKLIVHIVNDLAIAEAAVLLQPGNDLCRIKAALPEELKGLPERVVTGWSVLSVQVIKQIAQILVGHRNGSDELLTLLLLPCLFQLIFAWIGTHGELYGEGALRYTTVGWLLQAKMPVRAFSELWTAFVLPPLASCPKKLDVSDAHWRQLRTQR